MLRNKICTKSRNNCAMTGEGVGEHGKLTPGANFRNRKEPNTNAQRINYLTNVLRLPSNVLDCDSFLHIL